MKDDLCIVVIPYNGNGAQGNELKLAIRGWVTHFCHSNFKIVLVGENLPKEFDGHDWMVFMESKRVPERAGSYRQHLDYVNCFLKVYERFGDQTSGFIFTADDVYAVNDFDLADVQVLKAHASSFCGDPTSTNGWKRDMAKTRALLDREFLPCVNYTTHLPQWYDWERLLMIYALYSMRTESYVFENVYYNHYCGRRLPELLDGNDRYRLGVWSKDDVKKVPEAMLHKIWIVNSVDGWSRELEDRLCKHYDDWSI